MTEPPMANYSALRYLLNETAAYAIRSNLKKDDKSSTNIDYLKNVEEVNSTKALSYINKIGFNVGFKTAQLLLIDPEVNATSITNISNNALIDNPLEAMKFICRDVWKNIFGKQMDNLRTNHVGTFVLIDYKPVSYSNCYYTTPTPTSTTGVNATAERAPPFLEFNVGLIQGVLACLGIEGASVNATASPPADNNAIKSAYTRNQEQAPNNDVIHNSVIYTVETKN